MSTETAPIFRHFAIVFSIVAGVFDIFNGLTLFPVGSVANEWVYVATDFSILLAMIGWLGVLHDKLKLVGKVGWLVALFGVAFIVGPAADIGGINGYFVGTSFIGLGYLLFSADLLLVKSLPRKLPISLLLAVVISAMQVKFEWAGISIVLGNLMLGISFIVFGFYFLQKENLNTEIA